jgi:hydroxymethylglutaryl-CoA lyase
MSAPRPASVKLIEVGPREGFQFEGIGAPETLLLGDKIALIDALAGTGLKTIQIVSFVHPRIMPQMADAAEICDGIARREDVAFTGIYLNDVGLHRALGTPALTFIPEIVLSASEAFALRNQKRDFAADDAMQMRMAMLCAEAGRPVTAGNIMAAFGCNYEGVVPRERVLTMIGRLCEIAESTGGKLASINLADTMGWADPGQVTRMVEAVGQKFPELEIGLHLHDTRGMAVANVYAALQAGVRRFDTGIGGLGGCPFAGHAGAAGNVATEEVAFLCHKLGIETGVDLPALMDCARLAQRMVGHALPSRLLTSGIAPAISPAS